MPKPTDAIFFEAEDMETETGAWSVMPDPPTSGLPSTFRVLSGGSVKLGKATYTLSIAMAGQYRVWVRYSYNLRSFKVELFQNDLVGSNEFDTVPDPALDGTLKLLWESFDCTLSTGDCRIEMSKTGALDGNGRLVDCFVLTRDLTYQPDVKDFLTPLYIRVIMGNTSGFNEEPVRVHVSGEVFHLYMNKTSNDPGFELNLGTGDTTPWFDIAPRLWDALVARNAAGDVRVYFEVELFDVPNNKPFPPARSEYTIQFSRTNSEVGLIKSFYRADDGSDLWITVDYSRPEATRSSIEWSELHWESAEQTPSVAGRRPQKFPIITYCLDESGKSPNQVIGNNLATLSTLGFSGIESSSIDANVQRRMGFGFVNTQSFVVNSNANRPWQADFADIGKTISSELNRFTDFRNDEFLYIRLGDEIFSTDSLSLGSAESQFQDYLQSLGLTPSFFDVATWGEVKPVVAKPSDVTAENASLRKAYYYTMQFRSRLLVDFLQQCTTLVGEIRPGLRTAANAATELISSNNLLVKGVDWFALYQQNALTYGLFADANVLSYSQQVCGYSMDFARSACSVHRQPFGLINSLTRPASDVPVRAFSEVAHGASMIDFYSFGPYYVTRDGKSHLAGLYPALKEFNHAVGAVEDYLLETTRGPSQVALLYSHSSDIWDLQKANNEWSSEHQVFGAELIYLHLLLTHLGYPVEIVTEEDILHGQATAYKAIFVTGPNLQDGVLAALLEWTRAGGLLYLGPGAAERNQFNDPGSMTLLWESVGLSRLPILAFAGDNHYLYNVYGDLMNVSGKISDNGSNYLLDALCGFQEVAPLSVGKPLLTLKRLDDDTIHPCANLTSHGEGTILFVGCFLGLAYARGQFDNETDDTNRNPLSGQADLKHNYYPEPTSKGQDGDYEVWRKLFTNTEAGMVRWPNFSPRRYPLVYQTFFRNEVLPLIGWKPLVQVTGSNENSYLVEAHLLTGDMQADVLVLSNWTYERQSIRVTLKNYKNRNTMPWAAINPLHEVSVTNTEISFSMLIGSGDFIVIP